MRKYLFIMFFFLTSLCFSMNAFADDKSSVTIDKSKLDKGLLMISYQEETDKIIKVIMEKGDKKYVYNLRSDGVKENYDLQMGNGTYKVTVYKNLEGNSYLPIYTENVEMKVKDDKLIYLNSIQNINWDVKMKAIQKATALVKGIKNENKRLEAVYNYMVSNFAYDFVKWKNINNLPNPYIPSIDKTYAERKGICYDYSALFASMLRSMNIPVKLQMGYTKNVPEYHAWNEVYLTSQKKWIVIDTTYDAQMKKANRSYSMSKSVNLYSWSKTY